MAGKHCPTIEYLRQSFEYRDGRIFWRDRPLDHFKNERGQHLFRSRLMGFEAGGIEPQKNGDRRFGDRWVVSFYIGGRKGFRVRLHRYTIVWALHHDEIVVGLDHINRNQLDDKIENLRIATPKQNSGNASISKANKSGYKGVCWNKLVGKWKATIGVDWRTVNIGHFDTPEEAHSAYMKAAEKHFGEFATSGNPPPQPPEAT